MNPFERFDIDPKLGPGAVTERLRELIEEADEDERHELRSLWEELTMHPRRRLELALDAFPETRAPMPERRRLPPFPKLDADAPLSVAQLAVVPRVAGALSTQPEGEAAADALPQGCSSQRR